MEGRLRLAVTIPRATLRLRSRSGFRKEIGRLHVERLRHLPNGQQRGILLPAFDRADEGSVGTHSHGDGLLAEASRATMQADVGAEHLANVHPQDRRQSRILALRTIVRGEFSGVFGRLCFHAHQGSHAATVSWAMHERVDVVRRVHRKRPRTP